MRATLIAGLCFVLGTLCFAVEPPSTSTKCQIQNAKYKVQSTKYQLNVGFAATDITPKLDGDPVYMAGFGQNRKATGVHDPLMVRAVVLTGGGKRIALASVDVVGFFHPNVEKIRKQLPGFDYVLISSTHNHEGPDTLGIWGPNSLKSGVDPKYLNIVEAQIIAAVQEAEKAAQPATARIGKTLAPELLHDGREPYVKHDELVVLDFRHAETAKPLGILVQWNCHPETLSSKNTLISADYVGYTVNYLAKKYSCPVAYFTGTVGGLMTSLHVPITDEQGRPLSDGTYEKTERYGHLLGQAADKALAAAQSVTLTPMDVRHRMVFIPMTNKLYLAARWLGVLKRDAYFWAEDPYDAKLAPADAKDKPLAIRTEVGLLQFGELSVVAIPGEIYPELVLGKVQDPPDPGADFPDAPIEPAVYQQLKGPHRMIIGLANDEIGYILPKRQWDEKPPYCYGRTAPQYGEQNSVGPEAGPILCRAIKDLAERK
jgi:hypothetical protein